jgi:hypothetical protein
MTEVFNASADMPVDVDAAPRRLSAAAKVALGVLGVAIALWLASPVLWAGHLEEITANLKILAISADRGGVAGADTLSPLVSQYHYVTRLGVVLLLQAIDRLFGETGDAGFHALMVASWLIVLAASVYIARRWSRVGTPAIVAAIVVTPGIFESAFFFNDNMISAASALSALALVSRWNHSVAYALAGVLLAFAVLCRTDAAVLAPLLAGFCWLHNPQPGPLLKRGGAALVGGCLVIAPVFATTGVLPLDSFVLAKIFLPWSNLPLRIMTAFCFFGLPTLVLLAVGVADRGGAPLAAADPQKWRIVFWLYPSLVVLLAVATLSSQVRYVYPLLTPFVALRAGAALERIGVGLFRSDSEGRFARAVAIGIGLVLIAPPVLLTVSDGPRTATGRLWSPLLWRRWQIAQVRSMQRVQALVAEIDGARMTLVLAGHYNDEYFLKLRLLEDGYRPRPASEVFPDCPEGFAVYVKPGHVVAHIRTDNQYGLVPWPPHLVRAVQIRRALDCASLWRVDNMIFSAAGASIWGRAPDAVLFGALLARLQPSESFSQTLSVPFKLLLAPDAPAPASADTPLGQRTAEIETLENTPADLGVVNDSAAKALAGSKLTYADVARTFRPITLHGSAFDVGK